MMRARHGLSLSLILALFCAQLLLAWHAPSHIDAQPHDPHKELLAAADCQVCTHGQGMLALPSHYVHVVSQHAEPAPAPVAAPVRRTLERLSYPPRGPPASA